MPPNKYGNVFPKSPDHSNSADQKCSNTVLSAVSVITYFMLSISLTFYQRHLLGEYKFALTIVLFHLTVKWILSTFLRTMIHTFTGKPQLVLPFRVMLSSVAPFGFASGIDVGFSNWGLELVTVSLYTMTKSTTIIFILGFAVYLGLEKKSWSLVMIVFMISAGLVTFTYQATQFDALGFTCLILASFAAGLRWTFAQKLMQKSKLGLDNPLDMVYHVQPWMFIFLLPFTIAFEGLKSYYFFSTKSFDYIVTSILQISVGATIAFFMEVTEFLVVTYTSSLSLSIAGIFKEICILFLAFEYGGDQISAINVLGLIMCLGGISGHMIHKFHTINTTGQLLSNSDGMDLEDLLDDKKEAENNFTRNATFFKRNSANRFAAEHNEPLLHESYEQQILTNSDDSDHESTQTLFNVLQRRDTVV